MDTEFSLADNSGYNLMRLVNGWKGVDGFSTISTLSHLQDYLLKDISYHLDDFSYVSCWKGGKEVTLQWSSRNKPKPFSEIIKGLSLFDSYAFVKDYKCEWEGVNGWFDIKFKVEIEEGKSYEVIITIN